MTIRDPRLKSNLQVGLARAYRIKTVATVSTVASCVNRDPKLLSSYAPY